MADYKAKTADGTKTAPAYTYTSDADTGRYLSSAGDQRDAVAGGDVLQETATQVKPLVQLMTISGTVNAPGAAVGEATSGFYRAGANDLRAAINGADAFKFEDGYADANAGLKIGGGTEIKKILAASAVASVGPIANGAWGGTNVALVGAAAGDPTMVGIPAPDAGNLADGSGVVAYGIPQTNQVVVVFQNNTGGALTWTGATFKAAVFQF